MATQENPTYLEHGNNSKKSSNGLLSRRCDFVMPRRFPSHHIRNAKSLPYMLFLWSFGLLCILFTG